MFSLEGKTALITGAASGIGLAIAKRFTTAGATIVMTDIQDATDMAKSLSATFYQLDVSNEENIQEVFSDVEKTIGKLNILVNNAGVPSKDGISIEDSSLELFQKVIEINAFGVFNGLKYGPKVITDGGSIINTTSLGADYIFPSSGPYSASKATVNSLVKMAAAELSPRQIRVNGVAPSFINSPMTSDDKFLFEKLTALTTVEKRMAEPEEIAAIYHFLASDDSRYINGQIITADSGMSLGFLPALLNRIIE